MKEVDIADFKCPCGEGPIGSFVRFYSLGKIRCPHCMSWFKLKDMTKIQHQR
jgi:hypothetical protein